LKQHHHSRGHVRVTVTGNVIRVLILRHDLIALVNKWRAEPPEPPPRTGPELPTARIARAIIARGRRRWP
jgi:hypothetical protein